MLSTPSALAASTGSGASLAYFNTDVVGLTARFCNDVSRLIIASVMPIAQLSLVAAEISRNGSTAIVCTAGLAAAPDPGCMLTDDGLTVLCPPDDSPPDDFLNSYPRYPAAASANTNSTAPATVISSLRPRLIPLGAASVLAIDDWDSVSLFTRFKSARNSAADW